MKFHRRAFRLELCRLWLPCGLFLVCLGGAARAAVESPDAGMNWIRMGMNLFGGLALFLFGMDQMSDSLKAAAGERMKTKLARLTRNRLAAAAVGALVTAVIQSSSVTTVLVVGFVSAGIMTLTQSVGIIMGANVGTTITAQIVAFKVTEGALLFVAAGFGLLFAGKNDRTRHYGGIIMGIGLVFFGMLVMSDGMKPLRSYQPFLDLMAAMERPFLGILVGAAFTALVQASAATTGIVIVMATQGFVTLPAGIALALGANIGTCATALLAAIGKSREALRAAVVHVAFNVSGAILWLVLFRQLVEIAVWISPVHAELVGVERLAAEAPRQIANANTAFNVINTILFLPLAGVIARIIHRWVPDKAAEPHVIIEPKFLDPALIDTPSMALTHVRMEMGRVGEIVQEMLDTLTQGFRDQRPDYLTAVEKSDDKVDVLEERILEYLGRVRKELLTDRESTEQGSLVSAATYLENIGDVMESELVPLGRRALALEGRPSETIREMFTQLYMHVREGLAQAVAAVRDTDQVAAQEVLALKNSIDRDVDQVLHHQSESLGIATHANIERFRIEMEVLERLRRIYTLSKRLARTVLPAVVGAKQE